VVLAQRGEWDVLDDHHLVVVDLELPLEMIARILPVAGEQFAVRASDPGRRLDQAVAVGVLADREQQFTDGTLGTNGVDRLEIRQLALALFWGDADASGDEPFRSDRPPSARRGQASRSAWSGSETGRDLQADPLGRGRRLLAAGSRETLGGEPGARDRAPYRNCRGKAEREQARGVPRVDPAHGCEQAQGPDRSAAVRETTAAGEAEFAGEKSRVVIGDGRIGDHQDVLDNDR